MQILVCFSPFLLPLLFPPNEILLHCSFYDTFLSIHTCTAIFVIASRLLIVVLFMTFSLQKILSHWPIKSVQGEKGDKNEQRMHNEWDKTVSSRYIQCSRFIVLHWLSNINPAQFYFFFFLPLRKHTHT